MENIIPFASIYCGIIFDKMSVLTSEALKAVQVGYVLWHTVGASGVQVASVTGKLLKMAVSLALEASELWMALESLVEELWHP